MRDAIAQLDFLKRAYPGYRGEPLRIPTHDERFATPGSPVVVATPPTSQNRDVGHPVSSAEPAMVTGIRHWSTATYTRLAIDLSGEDGGEGVTYEAARVVNPDRIFFDLHHARLAPSLAGRSFSVTDGGFLTRIRAAQAGGDVTRVVLDVPQVAEYSAFLLPNPERLIIDIHGRQGPQWSSDAGRADCEGAARRSGRKGDGVQPAADAGDRWRRRVWIAEADGGAAGAEYGEQRLQRERDGGRRGERPAGQGGGDAETDLAAGEFKYRE